MLISLLIGALLGLLAGLGVGGGSLLMLWLTLVTHTAPATARAINLLFFLGAAGSVSVLRLRKGTLQPGTIIPAAIAGCIAAGICSWFASSLNPQLLRKVLGILFLITGAKELLYRDKKDR